MKRQDRCRTYETVDVPISVLSQSDLAATYLPPLLLIADAELAQMGEAGRSELERRVKERHEHVEAGRVCYVFQSKGYDDKLIWIVSKSPKGKEREKRGPRKGHLKGHSVSGPQEGKRLALMILEREDKGGVIYIDGNDWHKAEIIDLRQNECEALKTTGKHDWFYVPTGDDVCRSCSLVS
jgi:hypothetical protein